MTMLSRREFVTSTAIAASSLAFTGRLRAAEPELTDDGLHRQPWFLESFLDLKDDLTTATEEGKRFAIMWELKGCPYCKETHYVNFAKPEIENFVKEKFAILQLNIIGSKLVTDFDGEELSEKALAAKYGVRFTPSIQFFPESADELAKMEPRKREVARAQGYLKPDHFLSMFRFVEEQAYANMSFRKYLKAQS